jgi:hypothetical protein
VVATEHDGHRTRGRDGGDRRLQCTERADDVAAEHLDVTGVTDDEVAQPVGPQCERRP